MGVEGTHVRIAERATRRLGVVPSGYAQITADTGAASVVTLAAGLSVTFTAIAGRRYRFTFKGEVVQTVAGDTYLIAMEDTTVNLQRVTGTTGTTSATTVMGEYVSNASISGSKTWRINYQRSSGSGTITISAASTQPAYVLVEDIGPL